MTGKRIVFLIRELNHGGAAKMLAYIANIAAEVFDKVTILVIGNVTNLSLGLAENIQIRIIEKDSISSIKFIRILQTIWKIRKEINDERPDILIPFVSGNVIYAYLAVRNRYYIVGAERGNPEVLPPILKGLCKYIYPKCNYMLFQSEGAADFYFKGKSGNYEIIPNPCIFPVNHSRQNGEGSSMKIVSSCRLAREKNLDILIRAFQQCRAQEKAELFLYGEGEEEQSLKIQVHEAGLEDKIKFCGKVDNVSAHIGDADIFVLVSSGEGMPNGLIEALALGIPCITTLCMTNNTNFLVEDGVNGLIVKKRDAGGLADAIDRLIYEKELRNRLSENALKIRETLSEQHIHEKVAAFYLKILAELEEN